MTESSSGKSTPGRVRIRHAAEMAALHARVVQLETALERAADRNGHLEVEAGRLRAILGAVPVWVSYVDREQRYRFTNWAAGDRGADPTAEPTGSLVSEVLDEEVYRAIRPDLDRSLRGEFVALERTVRMPGERVASFTATYTPHVAADGTVHGVVVVVSRTAGLDRPMGTHGAADRTPAQAPGGRAANGGLR
jgi:PAS domain-containing protein